LLAPALQEDDAQLVTAEAVAVGGAYTVTGRKVQVALPGRAAAFVVLAREDKSYALFLVEGSAAGVRHEGPDARLALACLETGTLILDGAPAVKLGGADLIARVLASARIAVSCLLAGIGRGAVTAAMKYAHERKQFDRFLHEFVAMQERLSRGDARVEAARALAHGAARLRDRGDACGLAAARARLVAGEAAMTAADDALQVFGGYGFSREYPAERFYRDARFSGFGESHPPALYLNITKGLAP
jgi:alkylation response protein AidB-like acyl-CoA dehydrogenase